MSNEEMACGRDDWIQLAMHRCL